MSIWFSWFISDIMNSFVFSFPMLQDYINGNKKVNKKFIITYILCLLSFAIISNLFLYNAPKMLKTIMKILLSSILLSLSFRESISKTLMRIFLIYILFAIYDTLFGFVYIGVLNKPMDLFYNNSLYILIVNVLIAVFTYLTLLSKKVSSFIDNISKWYSGKSTINLVVNITLCVIALWFFINKNAYGLTFMYEYIINSGVIIIIIVFVIGFFKENSDKNQLKKKYDSLIDYAKTYEQEVVEKSKWQHEYENQLVLIRDKISSDNKASAINYINDLLKNKPTDENTEWLKKLSQFPDIGIKGLLHYKICQMKEKSISVFVDVDNDENIKSNSKIIKILKDNLQDISRILGVYLDNAIQASQEAINKYIVCELKISNRQIVFEISNTYVGRLDIEKMSQEKYSTKGKGHGYGLSLTRDILNRNKYLSEEKEINGIYFVQKLIISIKK